MIIWRCTPERLRYTDNWPSPTETLWGTKEPTQVEGSATLVGETSRGCIGKI
jgi:hypothetical protein